MASLLLDSLLCARWSDSFPGLSFSASTAALCPLYTRVPSLVSAKIPTLHTPAGPGLPGPPVTSAAASFQVSNPIPGAWTNSSNLLSPLPLPERFPCVSGFHLPVSINTSGQPLGLGQGTPPIWQKLEPHQSWGGVAGVGGTGRPAPCSRYIDRGGGRGLAGGLYLSSTFPGGENM